MGREPDVKRRANSSAVPTVSIGLPVYNGEQYLEQSVASILDQTFDDFELVISDNASTDATPRIIRSIAGRDDRVRWSRFERNLGASANYNHVFHESNGRYFKWAAHDDLLKPTFLQVCVEAHRDAPEPLATVYPPSEFIDGSGVVTHLDLDTQHTASRHASVRAYQVLQRMSMAHAVFGLHDASLLGRTRLIGSFVSSDYVLLLQLSLLANVVQLDCEPLFQRRVHEGMSRVANRTKEEVLRWFDPRADSRLSEQNRLRLEYAKSPYQVEGLNPVERAVCALSVMTGFTANYIRVKRGTVLR